MPLIEVEHAKGLTVAFECEANVSNVWVSRDILLGKTYPFLPFVPDVQVVLDIGANCGATSVYLAHHYPDAVVHSFEPAAAPRELLVKNTRGLNVEVHPIGLSSSDGMVPFYSGKDGASILGSVYPREINGETSETVELRDASSWAAEHGVDRIDVLKVDVEGSEVEILQSLVPLLPTTKVVYVEYGSRHLRREVFRILEVDHEAYMGNIILDQGECVFLRQDLLDVDGSLETLRDLFRKALG